MNFLIDSFGMFATYEKKSKISFFGFTQTTSVRLQVEIKTASSGSTIEKRVSRPEIKCYVLGKKPFLLYPALHF